MKEYGYIRVSTKEQHTDRQNDSLSEIGISNKNIYIDKQSGKDFERLKYRQLIKKLKEGDTVYIKSIDRLDRNYDEIIDQWRIITKEIRADIVIVDMPLLDTRAKGKDLTGTFIADLVLQILSYVAQTERENIRKRQAEGIASARARGVHLGRTKKPIPSNFIEIVKEWRAKKINFNEALVMLNVGKTYFYEKVKEMNL